MLTSFFHKSKPINFLAVGLFMSVYYVLENFILQNNDGSLGGVFTKIGFLGLYLFLMVLINFIVKRNEVTKRNTFTIVLFALFTISFPEILESGKILLSGLFVLLAFRRIISLKSKLSIKSKIFDASFWICLASLFFAWNILFLVIIYLAILFHAADDYRNWLIPLLSFFCVFVLHTCFSLIVYDHFFDVFHFLPAPNFDFSNYGQLDILLPLTLILAFAIWIFIDYLLVIQKASSSIKSSLVLVLAIWLCAITIVAFSPTRNGSEFLFFIMPTSIVGASYFQRGKDKIFNEILLALIIVCAVLFPFLA